MSIKWMEELTIRVGGGLFAGGGVAGSVFYASQHGFNTVGVASCGLAVGAAACLLGCLVGFLFGIPRAPSVENAGKYRPNTNLEQISDWLTKMIVGVVLTQVAQIPDGVAGGSIPRLTVEMIEEAFPSTLARTDPPLLGEKSPRR